MQKGENEMIGLIGAAAIGLLVGLSLEDDTKERIANDIKNRLYYKMMTGQEEHKPERVKPEMSYASYYNKYKAKPEEKEDEPWKKALKFDTYQEASAFLSELKNYVCNYGTLSIFDLCHLRCVYYGGDLVKDYRVDWSLNKYGWTEKMITTEATILSAIGGKISLPKPVLLI